MTLNEFIKCIYLPFPCHTQFVEAGFKDASLVSQTGHEERMRSLIATIRSHIMKTFHGGAKEMVVRAPKI